MGNLASFDASTTVSSDLIPADEYKVILTKVEIKDSQTDGSRAQTLRVEAQIVDGPHQNRRVWPSQNFTKRDGTRNNIGHSWLKQMIVASGLDPNKVSDTSELMTNRPVMAKVVVREEDNQGMTENRNHVAKWSQCKASSPQSRPVHTQENATTTAAQTVGAADVWQ